jgi:hypothetical protein
MNAGDFRFRPQDRSRIGPPKRENAEELASQIAAGQGLLKY